MSQVAFGQLLSQVQGDKLEDKVRLGKEEARKDFLQPCLDQASQQSLVRVTDGWNLGSGSPKRGQQGQQYS